MPFEAKWMNIENVMLNEVREGEIPYDIPYMWNLKRNDTTTLIYEIEADS